MKTMKIKLPNKISALIRVALDDLATIEKRKKVYEIVMDKWHVAREPDWNLCEVCFAGVVIAMKIDDPDRTVSPDEFDNVTYGKLRALDSLREGNISTAINFLPPISGKKIKKLNEAFYDPDSRNDNIRYDVVGYHTDRKAFKRDMRKMANKFESIGL